MGNIISFGDILDLPQGLDKFPDYCPICMKSVRPEYILEHFTNNGALEFLSHCPNSECGSLFFAVYTENPFDKGNDFILDYSYPYSKNDKEFPEEITELSPQFIEIYNQAHHADKEKLDMICGVGYRKALEYLVKDYIISQYPNHSDKIKKEHSITKCIKEYIDDSDIKEMAERATWLGNDETHYVKKWEDRDIQDLKNLIDLTVFFISKTIKAKRYKEEMAR